MDDNSITIYDNPILMYDENMVKFTFKDFQGNTPFLISSVYH